MIDRTETHVVVRVTVAAPAPALFAVLADPRRHPEIDGSGMVRASAEAVPLTQVGQVFAMRMHNPRDGDYVTENHVRALEVDRVVSWATALPGREPTGFTWTWELDPRADGRTVVTQTYDWSQVEDPAVLARVQFPRVAPEQMRATVTALVAAATGGGPTGATA